MVYVINGSTAGRQAVSLCWPMSVSSMLAGDAAAASYSEYSCIRACQVLAMVWYLAFVIRAGHSRSVANVLVVKHGVALFGMAFTVRREMMMCCSFITSADACLTRSFLIPFVLTEGGGGT